MGEIEIRDVQIQVLADAESDRAVESRPSRGTSATFWPFTRNVTAVASASTRSTFLTSPRRPRRNGGRLGPGMQRVTRPGINGFDRGAPVAPDDKGNVG